ncbi:MAG: sensor domain-containing diguanylate cyclase [Pseudomonadota bacterium]
MVRGSPARSSATTTKSASCCAVARTALLDTTPEPAFDRLTRIARTLVGAPVALISIVDRERMFFKSALGLPEPWRSRRDAPARRSFCELVVTSGENLVIGDARIAERFRNNPLIHELGVVAYLGIPLRAPAGHVIGAFCVVDPHPRAWTDHDVAWIEDLAQIAETEIVLRHAAEHDPLTGLANRRQFARAVGDALNAAAGDGPVSSVVAIDLDRFKSINDRFGHAVGDEVLKIVADRLMRVVTFEDLVARLGGDEFAVLVAPSRSAADVEHLVCRLHAAIARPVVAGGRLLRVESSIGVASTLDDVFTVGAADRLLARADAALYDAKAEREALQAVPRRIATAAGNGVKVQPHLPAVFPGRARASSNR